jgi:cation:H+ antiporter
MVTRGAEQISTSILVTFFGMTLTKATTLVGLSVVSIGTSLPEMLTSVVAAKKGENEIAFGNLVGSNVFNILFIIGLSGLVTPLGINGDVMIDMYLMLGVTVLALVMAMTKNIVTKKEGVLLIIVYAFYLIYIILRALAIV